MYDDGDSYYRPYGGAKTLSAARKFEELQEKIYADQRITWMLQDVMRNINSDEDASPEEKAEQIEAVASEYAKEIKRSTAKKESGILSRLKSVFSESQHEAIQNEPGAFFTIKETATGNRWMGVYSNNVEDREKEIITAEAHKEFADYCEKSQEYPELWLWHTKGTRIGVADWIDVHDGFALISGTIDVDVPPAVIDNLRNSPVPLGMSHGFGYKDADLVDGVYHRYRSVEVSVLPLASAANELTAFGTEVPAVVDEQRLKWLGDTIGDADAAKALYTGVEGLARYAKANGMTVKSVLEAIGEGVDGTVSPATDTPPAANAPAAPAAPAGSTEAPEDATVKAVKELFEAHTAKIDERFKSIESKIEGVKAEGDQNITKALREAFSPPVEKVAAKSAQFGAGGDVIDEKHPDYVAAEKSNGNDNKFNIPENSALHSLFGKDAPLNGFSAVR